MATGRLNWRQFSLRSLLIVMTLSCIVSSAFAWRQARQRQLARLVESFNVAMDDMRYTDAETIARTALQEFPQNVLAECMLEKATFGRAVIEGPQDGEMICGTFQNMRSTSNRADEPVYERSESSR